MLKHRSELEGEANGRRSEARSIEEFLEECRGAMRVRHMSLRTEKSYLAYIRRFIQFHRKRPEEMGGPEIESFLSDMAIRENVAASTQNVAFSALLFLYRHVLRQEFPVLERVRRADRPARLPTVLSREEVRSLLGQMEGEAHLLASLLYEAGLRVSEGLRLRVKDVDFERGSLLIRQGKGDQDRLTMLLRVVAPVLGLHLEAWRVRWLADGRHGRAIPASLPRRTRSLASTPTRRSSGPGNTSSPQPSPRPIRTMSSSSATTCSKTPSSVPSSGPRSWRRLLEASRRTPCATRS